MAARIVLDSAEVVTNLNTRTIKFASASSIIQPQNGDATNNRNADKDPGKGRNRQKTIECQHETIEETRLAIEASKRKFQSQLKEVERIRRTCASAAQPSKFDGTTSRAVFRRQFENC
jgi:hypothetical protein